MNHFFAYIRVSTTRQGEQGVSLQQQKDAIARYAERNGLKIALWFEEQETAAKAGRPVFGRMVKLLKRGKVAGVIIHKIDRSARNLRDWADLGELIDHGIDVHFANESLDLRSRGGRLSADIQAVVAADFIRNLRDETRKGFWGRIKQGLYPMPAPVGYLNMGKGQPKRPDPAAAPLVRQAFDLYATGRFNLKTLRAELQQLGLRTRSGRPLSLNGVSRMLNNSFYIGLIQVGQANETYQGAHEPIVPKAVFDRVREVLQGRLSARQVAHDFLFRRRLACRLCGRSLIGETHKGHVYYRCQSGGCPTTSVREESVDLAFRQRFRQLQFDDAERRWLEKEAQRLKADDSQNRDKAVAALQLRLAQIDERLNRLADAYIDRLVDQDLFGQRKDALLMERADAQETLRQWQTGTKPVSELLAAILERANAAYLAYKLGRPDEKRDLVDSLTSNREVERKTFEFMLVSPFDVVANRFELSDGSPRRVSPRTCHRLIQKIIKVIRSENRDVAEPAPFSSAA